jgi:hypothetical protein
MKKVIKTLVTAVVLVIAPNYFTNADCHFANWEVVDAAYYNSGGSFILMCPAQGIQDCCVEKSDNKEPKQLN